MSNTEEKERHYDVVRRQRRLIVLGDKIASAEGNKRKQIPLLRQFNALKQEQQNAINVLYGMTESQVSQIPLIKTLYAAN